MSGGRGGRARRAQTWLWFLLPLAACAPGGKSTSGDDTSGPEDTDTDTDTDTGEAPDDGQCWDDQPDGDCPGGRVCVDGRCVLPVDDGEPAPALDTLLAEWDGVWSTLDSTYAAFSAKPDLDWSAVHDAVASDLASADTRLESVHQMALGVAQIGDGHTYLRHPACTGLAVPSLGYSTIGACFTETDDGRVAVNQVSATTAMDLRPGDVLEAVDGRSVERLLADLAAQPGCTYVGSTPAMTRAGHIQTLGWREAAESTLTITRPGEGLLELPVELSGDYLRCDGRVPPAVEARGAGLEWARLDGDIGYVYFPYFGSYDTDGSFVSEPLQEVLRTTLGENTDIAGLVLDLRANAGGWPAVYFDLASWLYAEPTTLFYGAGFGGSRTPYSATPDPTLQLDIPVAVLVSARSFSAADFTLGFLIQTGRARAFGQPSGGGFGGGGLATSGDFTLGVNTFLALDLDGEPLEGSPPPVDVALRPSVDDLADGQDTVLVAALDWLRAE
jgi:carboxyl-terminal processing protease